MGRGKLVFKGDSKPAKKKKSKKKHTSNSSTAKETSSSAAAPFALEARGSASSAAAATAAATVTATAAADNVSSSCAPSVEEGRGRITTSGTVVTGHGTDLKSALRPGDAIIAIVNGREEMRVLTMVLSDMSAAISSPFSSNLSSPTSFRFLRRPRDKQREKADRDRKAASDKEEGERQAFGLYGTSAAGRKSGVTEMVYRERTEHGSYRIRREEVDGEASRSDLLSMRSKKKSDKYC